ncbi:putative PEP-binding protein [Paracoccus fistulariae]|uniref:Pyruvate, phosphate dikinase n=1 Tax=Paracoccus fistulariae TaxID=658446 RepID=A0ABY7SMK7_9RHOB|nr:putative PEP-binding protein [Paracoccus fistulariae]MDB6180151.1 PEP-utilizing enzyme [Paracoccus fistulariae]WCR08235.1 pyruvate, phosphate dikinase [Paracoccus fistulariae]
MRKSPDLTEITPSAGIERNQHGWRAKCLQRLIRLDLPVPRSFAIPASSVAGIASGQRIPMAGLRALFSQGSRLVSVRPSAVMPEWGGPRTVLNVGINDDVHAQLAASIGGANADALYLDFIQSYAINIARLDPDSFAQEGPGALANVLRLYQDQMEEPFPQDPGTQLAEVLRSMSRAWDGPTARLLRQAKGAPADAPLGLVVQDMAPALGPGLCGSGTIQLIDAASGKPGVTGRFRGQSQGGTVGPGAETLYLVRDARGPSLEEAAPALFEQLVGFGTAARARLREEMQIEFVVTDSKISVIDATRVQRSSRANVRVAVALARDGIISSAEAVMRVEPRALVDLLHHQVDPSVPRQVIARGINASPGAATGKIVFSAAEAQAAAARDEACILIRRETGPEDIRGMHAAVAVLTERGGTSSHAAVIARGLGKPCIVGATGLNVDLRHRRIKAGGTVLKEGDEITIDGTSGEVLAGQVALLGPALDDSFNQLLDWADQESDIIVRANADTPEDARTARNFKAQGIGLCRTEHMFFEANRLPAMREMIFADSPDDRRLALERILPMQRQDFSELFEIMAGMPVTIRLFDPPLHEFLPHDREGIHDLAESLDLPLSDVTRRVEALSEFNPMLGMRGVRLGITVPEIYDMQARAIFEAAIEAARRTGQPIVPEIMIPLVSAVREVEIVKNRIDAIAAEVRNNHRIDFDYKLGVMVETPRATLRAGEIAAHLSFLSFGTNDLTQMTYGLSRDDAGRFMGAYVGQGVFAEDPFHILDHEGVGELILTGVQRARDTAPDITLSICGEHGGNPESIAFCHEAGMDHVSCSPFRVPIARLAAAQATIHAKGQTNKPC